MTEPLELSEDQIERIRLRFQDIDKASTTPPAAIAQRRPILTDARRPPDAE